MLCCAVCVCVCVYVCVRVRGVCVCVCVFLGREGGQSGNGAGSYKMADRTSIDMMTPLDPAHQGHN